MPLTHIFNDNFFCGKFLSDLKSSRIIPVHKICNRKSVEIFLLKKYFISSNQFGFVSGRSTGDTIYHSLKHKYVHRIGPMLWVSSLI